LWLGCAGCAHVFLDAPLEVFPHGGLDQVALTTGADLLALDQLDQKLWVALSCPVKGLDLDEKTLALIDTDGDNRIRVPELLAAVRWATARLKDAGVLLTGTDGLALSAIDDTKPEGKALFTSAKQILANIGKKDAATITVVDASDIAKIFGASPLNGDGVIPPKASADAAVQALIKDIIACTGGKADRSGVIGVTAEQVDAFSPRLPTTRRGSTRARRPLPSETAPRPRTVPCKPFARRPTIISRAAASLRLMRARSPRSTVPKPNTSPSQRRTSRSLSRK
jgi:hypothetical protein